jgi:hypothetical protein
MEQFKKLATLIGLYPKYIYNIQNKPGKAYRTIIGFGKTEVTPEESTLVVMDTNGQRSAEFSAIMHAYYL